MFKQHCKVDYHWILPGCNFQFQESSLLFQRSHDFSPAQKVSGKSARGDNNRIRWGSDGRNSCRTSGHLAKVWNGVLSGWSVPAQVDLLGQPGPHSWPRSGEIWNFFNFLQQSWHRGQSYKANSGINYIKNGFNKLNFTLNYINFDVI